MKKFNTNATGSKEARTIHRIDRYLDLVQDPKQAKHFYSALEAKELEFAGFLLMLPKNNASLDEKRRLFDKAYIGSGIDEEATLDLLLFVSSWVRQIEKLTTATGEPIMDFIQWDSAKLWSHFEELYDFVTIGDGETHVFDKRVIEEHFTKD